MRSPIQLQGTYLSSGSGPLASLQGAHLPNSLPTRGRAQRAAPGWSLQAFQAIAKTETRRRRVCTSAPEIHVVFGRTTFYGSEVRWPKTVLALTVGSLAIVGLRAAEGASTRLEDGLLHWWPDPAEGTDEVTGRKGIRRGFGPVEENPDNRFGYAAGWVELGPGITNHTFTLSGWLRQPLRQTHAAGFAIIAQDSGSGTGWRLRRPHGIKTAVEFSSDGSLPTGAGLLVKELYADWHAFAVRTTPDQIELWVDGIPVGTRPATWTRSSEPELLTVGNSVLGSAPWDGDLRDIRLHGRLLSDAEIQSLAVSSRSERRDLPTAPDPAPVQSVILGVANPSHYSLQHFTTDHGLLSSEIQCLLQARNGALWLGAEEGLARFNGRNFWTTDEKTAGFSVTGTDVGAIAEDRFGTLWLGMFHGLVSLRGEQWQAYTNIGPARFLRRVFPAGDGTVWLAGYRDLAPRGLNRLRRFDPVTSRLQVDVSIPGQVRDLRPASDGVWIGTDDPAALWRFHESTGSVETVAHLAATGDAEFPPTPCVRLAHDIRESEVHAEVSQVTDGSFQWVQLRLGTNGPAFTWTRNFADWRLSNWKMIEASGDASFRDWIPAPGGLLQRDGGQWERLPLGGMNSETMVTALAPNAEGGVWAATAGDGLWLVQPRQVRMLTPQEGWGLEEVHSLMRMSDGRLLVGGEPNTLARIDPRFLIPPEVSPFQKGGSLTLERSDGTVLRIGTPNGNDGLCREQGFNQRYYAFTVEGQRVPFSEVSQLLPSSDGSVWIVDGRGVFHIPQLPDLPESVPDVTLFPPQFSAFLYNLPKQVSLFGLAEARDGAIWVGSAGAGLFRIFQGQVENFPDPDPLPDSPCVPLGFAADGTLWLGSEAGLGIWRGGRYRWVRPADGLPESVVCDVEEAEGHLWLAGRRGIHAIRRSELEDFLAGHRDRISAISLGRSDGLASTQSQLKRQPAMAQTDDGHIWVATAKGVAYFHPRQILAGLRSPPVALDGLTANGRTIPLGPHRVVLPPGEGQVVEIAFSSLSFVAPERVSFQYQLTGPKGRILSDETRQSRAVFTHLKPGRHVFTVAARSGNGLVSDPPARVEFDVEPHFYQTATFSGLAALGGLGVISGFVSLRLRRARRAAATAERRRIARDMHDDLGAELSRLALRTDRPEPAASSQEARELLRSLDEIVWVVNPCKDSLDSAVNYLGTWIRDYFAGASLDLKLDMPVEVPDLRVSADWRHHLLRSVKEACRNILKHARATRVEFALKIGADGRSFELDLRDNGCGFDLEKTLGESGDSCRPRLGGNGLGNLRRRAEQLGGSLVLTSAPGQGTRIRLTVPLPAR